MKRIICMILLILLVTTSVAYGDGTTTNKELVLADAGWDSIKFHNAVAGLILEKVYGFTWREVPGSTTVLHEGLLKGEVDVHMEVWTDNISTYEKDLLDDKFKDLGVNFDDNNQGLYIPRYMIEGENAVAPDLKHVWDLKKYTHLFPDDETKDKGRVYGAIPGWEVDEIMYNKYLHYNLDEDFVYFRPGSDAALSSALTSAYEKKEPIVAYYWEPTWLMGKYDFVLLEDEPFDEATYKAGNTALPSVKVNIGVSNNFYEENPNVIDFLTKYKTSSKLTSEALAYMQDTGANYQEAANWFLKENDYLLDEWLIPEESDIVRAYLNDDEIIKDKDLMDFPVKIPINFDRIDSSVRGFSIKYEKFFNSIRIFLGKLVNIIYSIISFIPWFITLVLVILVGWKISGKITTGLLYGVLLFLIGALGLWNLMNETLSIVIASVIISLALGFPLGILISTSERVNEIVRPILDTMQTMPVFVYLIPALLFFGLGKPPAVIATTIYAIVPIIRLTSHGIRQIDKEIVEASRAFGSTKLQTLIKVQIPQALPTIMAGVNQTLMMAMSMVVTTSMIGATGLGMEVLIGVNRVEIGRGLVSGTAVVIIAVILDRLTQGFVKGNGVRTNE